MSSIYMRYIWGICSVINYMASKIIHGRRMVAKVVKQVEIVRWSKILKFVSSYFMIIQISLELDNSKFILILSHVLIEFLNTSLSSDYNFTLFDIDAPNFLPIKINTT